MDRLGLQQSLLPPGGIGREYREAHPDGLRAHRVMEHPACVGVGLAMPFDDRSDVMDDQVAQE